jgi:hypothetical protein
MYLLAIYFILGQNQGTLLIKLNNS